MLPEKTRKDVIPVSPEGVTRPEVVLLQFLSINDVDSHSPGSLCIVSGVGRVGKQLVAVTHDVIIKELVAYALSVSNSVYRRLKTDPASLTVLNVSNGKYTNEGRFMVS